MLNVRHPQLIIDPAGLIPAKTVLAAMEIYLAAHPGESWEVVAGRMFRVLINGSRMTFPQRKGFARAPRAPVNPSA